MTTLNSRFKRGVGRAIMNPMQLTPTGITSHRSSKINKLTSFLAWTALSLTGLLLLDNALFAFTKKSSTTTTAESCSSHWNHYFPIVSTIIMTMMEPLPELAEEAEDAEECEEGEEAKTDLEGMMEHINIENNIARLSGLSLKTSTSRSRNGSSGGPGKTRCPTVLPASYNGRNSLFLFADSFIIPTYFSFQLSTQENYGEEDRDFRGPFKEIRANLDFEYHGNYKKERQAFQDRIIMKMLDKPAVTDSVTGLVSKTPTEPWIIFTAGTMGAGKGYAMKQLSTKGLFPWESYIIVDPDEIRSHFTEYHLYAKFSPIEAGNLTHKEAGYICEIVAEAAMKKGYNVLIDGSLWDYKWYQEYFKSLKGKYPISRIAILHITAPREAVFERAAHRAKMTGRVVPTETLENSLRQVPISVKKLAPMADFFAELDNAAGEVKMTTEGITWDSFRDNWAQTCSE